MASADAVKAAHSVYYEANTSEIKDDVAQLVSCVKTGTGPLNKQEALFLLWHHALCGDDAQAGLVDANVVPVCLTKVDNPEATAASRTAAAGILATLSQGDIGAEAIAKSRVCSLVLHKCLEPTGSHMAKHAMDVLVALASRDVTRSGLLRSAEQQLDWAAYASLLEHARDHGFVTSLAIYLKRMVRGKEDRRAQAAEAGLCEALLHALQHQKSEQCCRALAACVEEMCGDRTTWPRLLTAGAIRNLVDLLGPPPATIIKFEQEQQEAQRHSTLVLLQQPTSSSIRPSINTFADRTAAAGIHKSAHFNDAGPLEAVSCTDRESDDPASPMSRSKSAVRHNRLRISDMTEGGEALRSPAGSLGATTKRPISQRHPFHQQSGASLKQKASGSQRSHTPEAGSRPRPAAADTAKQPHELLSTNSMALKWESSFSTAMHAAVAGALYALVQEPECCRQIGVRLAVPRMVALLAKVVEAAASSGKKGRKKGGLTLLPEQEALLVALTGCLKFLTLQDNTNSFRVAHLGATRHLMAIADTAKLTLLRRNAQAVLNTVTLLAENRGVLKEAKLPEELFVEVPMGLTSTEHEQLAIEFPDAAQLVA